MNPARGARANFRSMEESTAEDWTRILIAAREHQAGLAGRVIAQLRLLDDDHGGLPVSRLEHCLQTATRAQRDGRDEEYVVCALLHDIGDLLCPSNHADMAAVILKPYVSEGNHWMVANHTVFQGLYYFHHLSRDRFASERFRGYPYFEYTAEFCRRYDQISFDTAYDSLPLEVFEPLLHRLLERPKQPPSFTAPAAA